MNIMRLLFSLLLLCSSGQAFAECNLIGWDNFLAPGAQEYEVVENAELEDGSTMFGVKFGTMVGEYAKVYLFLQSLGDSDLAIVSLGSYATFNLLSDEPVYHLDHYQAESHSTLDWFNAVPKYSDTRKTAIEVFLEDN